MNTKQTYLLPQYHSPNLQRLHGRIDAVLNDYSKVLAIRLDLHIAKQYQSSINHSYMTHAIARLRNNMRCNRMFDALIGYAWKLEYGIDRGWHLHILFLFDGQKVWHDEHLSSLIGQYWNQVITQGMGQFYSCNLDKQKYRYEGIGMVDYSDVDKVSNLKRAASYLTKVDEHTQSFVDASGKAIRSFGMSQYQPKNVNAGRPRMYYEF